MIITADIGNSNITVGGFENGDLNFVFRISTVTGRTSNEYASLLVNSVLLNFKRSITVDGACISSVVPPLTSVFSDAIKLAFDCKEVICLAPGVKTGVTIHCDDPSSVGADIISACAAVSNIYSKHAIIVDFGTVTKITLMKKDSIFSGVSFMPGITIGLKAMSSETAQLPYVGLENALSPLGKNTIDSIKAGAIFGNASMVDGMIDRICETEGEDYPIYATGGLAGFIVPHCKHNLVNDENLILKGLLFIYQKNHR